MQRASSFLASRRGSSEAFEDALESLDPPHPSADLSNDYSAYAFALKAPLSEALASQAESPTRAFPTRAHAEPLKAQTEAPTRAARKTLLCYNTASMPRSSGKRTGGSREAGSEREACAATSEPALSSPTPHPALQSSESQLQGEGKGKGRQQESSAATAAAAAAAHTASSSRCLERGRPTAAAEREEGSFASSGSPTSPSEATGKQKDAGGAPIPRAASQETRRVDVPRRAIGRYSSVPAFSAADRVRIDRFKVRLIYGSI